MKIRLLSLVLAVLLVFPGAAYAVNVDAFTNMFSEYSTEALLALRVFLDTEIASRDNTDKEVTVPVGVYIVGLDIPAGVYTIHNGNKVLDYSSVWHYSSSGLLLNAYTFSGDDYIGKIELEHGQKLDIMSGPVIMSTYKGLGF